MNLTSLKKLEYYQILEKLSNYCHTYIGKEYALGLLPYNNKTIVKQNLMETEQGVALIERNGTPPLSEISNDINVYIKILESSLTLSAKALLDICSILEMGHELKTYFEHFINDESFENLNIYFSELYTNTSVASKIRKSILPKVSAAFIGSSILL